MIANEHIYAVILCGGGGTRLWPKSRAKTPKQFLHLTGKEAMVQVAASRVTKIVSWDHVVVVTNALYQEHIRMLLPQVPPENIIAEPEKKDTAMAMLVGALFARSKDPEAIVINGASDHVVEDEHEFVRVMGAAIDVASRRQNLITVGIIPTRPDTAFGYVKVGEHMMTTTQGCQVFRVDSFTEKPNEATARAFLSTGKYFWNANMYVWSVEALIESFRLYKPDILEAVSHLMTTSGQGFHDGLAAAYASAPSISIDYAISEKAANLVLIPGDFGWNDVGDWKVVYELGKKDLSGNVLISDSDDVRVMALNSHGNLVHSDNRLIGLVGVHDMVVIDTGEILLIIPKDKSQDVKKIVERLKEEGRKEYL